MQYYLAIDIGAGSGRHILGWVENGKLNMEEVYRFPNVPVETDGRLTWDIGNLYKEIIQGFKRCKQIGKIPTTFGIDTWAVDYVLLDEHDKMIEPVYCYRDKRGALSAKITHMSVPFAELYKRTGIQYQPFNSVYQLYDDKITGRLQEAKDFLMLPEYLMFLLTGKKCKDYINATSTGLINFQTRDWDFATIKKLGLKKKLFQPLCHAPTLVGGLKQEIAEEVGFSLDGVLVATHDTASAVLATPKNAGAYLSSGTWSLIGTELLYPITTPRAEKANFTNEGAPGGVRFQKNIMGLWMISCLKKDAGFLGSFEEIAEGARGGNGFDYRLDVNAKRYLNPKSIRKEILVECKKKAYPLPKTLSDFAHAIYNSLAHSYDEALKEIEVITNRRFESICIIGGGNQNRYLNELTEKHTGKEVVLGETEATAAGNLLMQLLYLQKINTIHDGKALL